MRTHTRRSAFTLIELLVVVAIISLLLSILLPSLAGARLQARTVICSSNMRQLALGWATYTSDNRDTLPGSTNDYYNISTGKQPANHPGYPVDYNKYRSLDWLGTIGESGDQTKDVPSKGTIFPYVGRVEEIYKCPQDKLDVIDRGPFGNVANETKYSYTSPSLLSGAKPASLVRTMWHDGFSTSLTWSNWGESTRSSLPWIMVEENESEALAYVTDSAWGNVDSVAPRHSAQKSMVGYIDGHAGPTKFQRSPVAFTAWHTYYELSDRRVITAGYWYDKIGKPIRFDYLRGKNVNGVVAN